jgi:Flp pilus assembly pilin Flp
MSTPRSIIQRFLQAESGPTAVEYAVILGLIIAVAMVGIGLLGTEAFNLWNDNAAKIDAATN